MSVDQTAHFNERPVEPSGDVVPGVSERALLGRGRDEDGLVGCLRNGAGLRGVAHVGFSDTGVRRPIEAAQNAIPNTSSNRRPSGAKRGMMHILKPVEVVQTAFCSTQVVFVALSVRTENASAQWMISL